MNVKVYSAWKLKLYLAAVTAICLALCCALPAHAQSDDQRPSQESVTQPNSLKLPSDQHYKPRTADESEFDNSHDPFAQHWQDSEPPYEYEDTEFGNLLYNEASVATKLEVLRLLSKETPSTRVFLTALSMGLGVEETLQAAVRYQPEKSRGLAASAVSVLPVVPDSRPTLYSSYVLSDLEREDVNKPYEVKAVMRRFFENRQILRPYPDWIQGQYHFLASARELLNLVENKSNGQWYSSKSKQDISNRPVFVSLYEDSASVMVDSEKRIKKALADNPSATLPVVFIFNRLNERAISDLGFPTTIRGVQQAYLEKGLMLTPTPEWQIGEHHIYAPMTDVYEAFEIPSEEDFEAQAWQNLLADARNYAVDQTSFLVVVFGANNVLRNDQEVSSLTDSRGQLLAAWDDPRTESAFPYVHPRSKDNDDKNGEIKGSLNSILNRGLMINRPDLIAALNALGVKSVPISFYYLDQSRQRPFLKTSDALLKSVIGAGAPYGVFGGDGGFSTPVCASPPCTEPQ